MCAFAIERTRAIRKIGSSEQWNKLSKLQRSFYLAFLSFSAFEYRIQLRGIKFILKPWKINDNSFYPRLTPPTKSVQKNWLHFAKHNCTCTEFEYSRPEFLRQAEIGVGNFLFSVNIFRSACKNLRISREFRPHSTKSVLFGTWNESANLYSWKEYCMYKFHVLTCPIVSNSTASSWPPAGWLAGWLSVFDRARTYGPCAADSQTRDYNRASCRYYINLPSSSLPFFFVPLLLSFLYFYCYLAVTIESHHHPRYHHRHHHHLRSS